MGTFAASHCLLSKGGQNGLRSEFLYRLLVAPTQHPYQRERLKHRREQDARPVYFPLSPLF